VFNCVLFDLKDPFAGSCLQAEWRGKGSASMLQQMLGAASIVRRWVEQQRACFATIGEIRGSNGVLCRLH